jgi:hypothetical protein
MKIKHKKKYYVGGLISLLILPVLFFISTIGARNKAVHYASIFVESTFNEDWQFTNISVSSIYLFEGVDEATKLKNFQQYFYTHTHKPKEFHKLTLPNNCSYNFFVQVADILHRNKFVFGVSHKTIVFVYDPRFIYEQEYQSASTDEEYEYVRSEFAKIVSTIKECFSDEPIQRDRTLKYYDQGYFPFGSIWIPPNSVR